MPVEDETGPCNGVKGAVDVYDPPLEARVPRLDRCCLKQKVGYSRDTAPKNSHSVQEKPDRPVLHREVCCARPPFSRIEIRADNGRFSILSFSANRSCKPELWLQIIWRNG